MKRSYWLLVVLTMGFAGCSPADGGSTSTTGGEIATTGVMAAPTTTNGPVTTITETSFPVTIDTDDGPVTIEAKPEAIVSLSATATEMLFAIGAGDQVVAVDDQSNYPANAPATDLSGIAPNVEAILSYSPDLVVIAYDSGDLITSLQAQDVSVISYGAAITLDDTYRQIEGLGLATGHAEAAVAVNEQIKIDLNEIVADTPQAPEGTDYYHEVDNTYFTATSSTFIGQVYSMFAIENIADPADVDGAAFGFPQLTSEFIVAADPDIIFLGNAFYGESVESVSARPGWGGMGAVEDGDIVELDSDVVSRWGPRVVDFARSVAAALTSYVEG
jgi:iron complex transport system substrate-binding protein